MTPQEALNLLNDTEFAEKHQGKEEYTDMLLMCKEALEKQIPKKPTDKTLEYDGCYGRCPGCNRVIYDYKDRNRCYNCGQALDWSDTE